MTILGIESSCDETAAALVKDGREVLSSVVYTQIKLHRPYGGVVPEIASRAHVEKISGVVREALVAPVDAVAVTYGPGLASSLIVGLAAAKGFALAHGVPLFGINHVEAHLHAPFLVDARTPVGASALLPDKCVPALGLAVSGGHTTWIDMPAYGEYEVIGRTLDDAAGEAFDKAAKLLGLGYPGGPVIDRRAGEYSGSDYVPFPQGRPRDGVASLSGLDAELCISFSGLKTALLRYSQRNDCAGDLPRVCASYQRAIVEAIADRTGAALKRKRYKSLVVGGGVSLNGALRARLAKVAAAAGVDLLLSPPQYCGDNAAMIAGLAYWRRNVAGDAAFAVDVNPTLEAGEQGS